MKQTTRDKIASMFKQEWIQRIADVGLEIVDREDYRILMEGYQRMAEENKSLRAQLAAERDKNQVRLFDEEATG